MLFNLTSSTRKGEEFLYHNPLFEASEGQTGAGSEGGGDDYVSIKNNVDGTIDAENNRGDDDQSNSRDECSKGDADGDWVPSS